MSAAAVPSSESLVADRVAARVRFLLLTLIVYTLQVISNNATLVGATHWFIPDGLTYHGVLDALSIDGLAALGLILPEQFAGVPANPLLFLFYYPFYLSLGVFGYFLANQLLVQMTCRREILAAMLLTPYFLLSFALPSKDLMVLALFIPFLAWIDERRYLAAAMVCAAIFLVRDGAGVTAMGCLVTCWLAPRANRARLACIVLGVTAIAILNVLVYEYLGDAFIFARNIQIAEDEGNYDLGGQGADTYLIRLFGNATNLAFRPVFFDSSGDVPMLGIAYWVSGISQAVCTLFAIRILWDRKASGKSSTLAMLYLVSLAIVSINPLVQPRYQLCFTLILLGHLLVTQPRRRILLTYAACVLASAIAALAYVVSGIGLPSEYEWAQITPFL